VAFSTGRAHTLDLDVASLLRWLHEAGRLSDERAAMADAIIAEAKSARTVHPITFIAEHGWLDARDAKQPLNEESITRWLAERFDLPFERIDPLSLDPAQVTSVTSYAYAQRHEILPLEVGAHGIRVATANPLDRGWEEELAHLTRKPIQRVVAMPTEIRRYLLEFYSLAQSVHGAGNRARPTPASAPIEDLEHLTRLSRHGQLEANDQHVVTIVDWLLQYAFDQKASDIHLEPGRSAGKIRFRIDGLLHEVYQMPVGVFGAVISRLKILARLDIAERRRPQDGRLKTQSPQGTEIELRLSTMPAASGEKLVLRIFNPDIAQRGIDELGFGETERRTWRQLTRHTSGLLLVTGPTGSGKTTTLYATLRELARPEVNVCTVEDPIELIDPQLNQMQVQPSIGLHFSDGIRTLLRQDPDVIMVGEIRDRMTAEMAIQAALTGHLVLSTVHTTDAVSAITRLLDIGIPAYLLRATLIGILAQRLPRRLCSACRRTEPPKPTDWAEITGPWKLKCPDRLYAPVGCLTCRQTGYAGRQGVYELLDLTGQLREGIRDDMDLSAYRRRCHQQGLVPLRIQGLRQVINGTTSVREILHVTPHPDEYDLTSSA